MREKTHTKVPKRPLLVPAHAREGRPSSRWRSDFRHVKQGEEDEERRGAHRREDGEGHGDHQGVVMEVGIGPTPHHLAKGGYPDLPTMTHACRTPPRGPGIPTKKLAEGTRKSLMARWSGIEVVEMLWSCVAVCPGDRHVEVAEPLLQVTLHQ